MPRAAYAPTLPNDQENPLFLSIARQIAQDIQRRVLRPGARLPGSRALSKALGVHRNTALAALAELTQQGWIKTEERRGTFVAESFPETRSRRLARPAPLAPLTQLELPDGPPQEPFPSFGADVLPLVGGTPDYRLVPTAELARAYR